MKPISLSPSKRKELETFINTRFLELKQQRDPYDIRVKNMCADYNSIPGKKDNEWENNFFVPYMYSVIKTIYPRLYFSIFGNQRWLQAVPEASNEVGKSNQMSTFMQRLLEKIGFVQEMKRAIKRAMIYPCVVIKEMFNTELNMPTIGIVDHFDYWQDCAITDIEDSPDCFHRIVRSKSYVKNKFKTDDYYKDAEEFATKTTMNPDIASIQATVTNYFMANGDQIIFSNKTDSVTNKPIYENMELLEWWGKYDWNDDGVEECIVATMINRTVLARVIENPNKDHVKPFRKMAVDDEPVGFYPKTYTQILAPLQYMLNDVVNKRYDNFAIILNKMFKVRRNSVLDYETLFSAPGNVIELDDLNDLSEFQFGSMIGDSYTQESMIRQDMQLISGMVDYSTTPEALKGVGNTATGMSILTSDAASKYREPLDNIKDCILNIAGDMFALSKEHSDKMMFRSVRAYDAYDVYNITPEDFKRGYSFSLQLKNFMPNKQAVLQNMITLLNVIGNTQGVNVPAYLKNLFDLMDEIKNPDEVLPALRKQTDDAIKQMRESQTDDITKIADAMGTAANDIRTQALTPEESLINGVPLGKPMNPTLNKGEVDMTSIQNMLGGT